MEEGGEGGKQHDHPNSASQATADASSSSGTKALKRPSVENPSATDPCGGTTGASKRPCVEHLSAGAGNHSFVGDHPNSASQVTASAGTKAKAKKIPWAKLKAKLKAKFGQPGDPGWVPSYIVTFEGGRFVSKLAEWDGPLKVPGIFTYPPNTSRFVYPKKQDADADADAGAGAGAQVK